MTVFGYLKHHPKGAVKFPGDIEKVKLNKDWKDLYPHTKEKIPKDAPASKGKCLKIIVDVDADLAHNLETRKSATRILLY